MAINSVQVDAAQDLGDPEIGPQVLEQKGVRGYLARHSMTSYVIRRFALYVFTLWAAISATFIFFRLIPGNPIAARTFRTCSRSTPKMRPPAPP